jgi:hypothetical protein
MLSETVSVLSTIWASALVQVPLAGFYTVGMAMVAGISYLYLAFWDVLGYGEGSGKQFWTSIRILGCPGVRRVGMAVEAVGNFVVTV